MLRHTQSNIDRCLRAAPLVRQAGRINRSRNGAASSHCALIHRRDISATGPKRAALRPMLCAC